ncbi:MAG: hypothetical protein HKN89_05105 [Eudoraea sp.]|nr:hypothetical protein [Eudoraea sp.]
MKQLLRFALCTALVLAVFGCKESAPATPADQSTPEAPETPKVASLEIDPLTDPLVVGKDYIQMFSDTLGVQMYLMTMKPGDSVGLHVHPDHTVYVLEGGKLMLYLDGTETMEMELPTGAGFVSGPLTDAATNIGDTEIQLIISEIYRPRE